MPTIVAARIFSFRRLWRWCHIPNVTLRNHSLVIFPQKWLSGSRARGFTLVEIVVTIAIIVIVLLAGVSLLGGTGPQARRAGTDMLTGMIEQGRTAAITTRSSVVLALVEPSPGGDQRCRIGLFKVNAMPDDFSQPIAASSMSRWRILETGVVLIGGEAENGLTNPLDGDKVTLTYGKGQVSAHIIAFNSRGGLQYPAGSSPIVLRVAEGGYRNGTATPNRRAGTQSIPENLIKIGRVTARPYRIDG